MVCPGCKGTVLVKARPCDDCGYVFVGAQTNELAVLSSIDRSVRSIKTILQIFLIITILSILVGFVLSAIALKF